MFNIITNIATCLFPIILIGLIICPKNIREEINKVGESNVIVMIASNVIIYGSFGLTIIGILN